MTEAKPKARIHIQDGKGGLVELRDYRFTPPAPGDIELDVAADLAENWLEYLNAELRQRGWSSGGISQLLPEQVGGSITIQSPSEGQIIVVWRGRRGRAITVRARALASAETRNALVDELLATVTEKCGRGDITQHHRAGVLQYRGLPWRGELWLDDSLRLSQPSVEDRAATDSSRIICVDWLVSGIDAFHAGYRFLVAMRELSVFLSVVLGYYVAVPRDGERVWVRRQQEGGSWASTLETTGFADSRPVGEMPTPGEMTPTPLTTIPRPCFASARTGIEESVIVPADVGNLWRAFTALKKVRRAQFLRSANLWHAALSLGPTYETTAFSLMVAACESLKPQGAQFRDTRAYHVVQAFFGPDKANSLQGESIPMQDVRDKHLHLGSLFGREFRQAPELGDPSFLSLSDKLYWVARAAIAAWLLRGGRAPVAPPQR
jgi:hypothetical protein